MFLARATLARDEHPFPVACHLWPIRLSIATKLGDCPTIANGAPSQRAVIDRPRISTARSQRKGAMSVESSSRAETATEASEDCARRAVGLTATSRKEPRRLVHDTLGVTSVERLECANRCTLSSSTSVNIRQSCFWVITREPARVNRPDTAGSYARNQPARLLTPRTRVRFSRSFLLLFTFSICAVCDRSPLSTVAPPFARRSRRTHDQLHSRAFSRSSSAIG